MARYNTSLASATITGEEYQTIGYKIYSAAMNIANNGASSGINDDAFTFVSKALFNAGVSGIRNGIAASEWPLSTDQLVSLIDDSESFSEVNVEDVKIGDLIILGKGCTEPASIGIVAFVPEDKELIHIYTNLGIVANFDNTLDTGNKVDIETIPFESEIINDFYPYKAYRYTADLTSSEKKNYKQSCQILI